MPGFRIEMPEDLPRYRPRGRVPLLDFMRNYINERFDHNIIFRYNLMMECVGNGYKERTVDTYRSYLTGAGYLKIIDRGIYRIVKEIPHNITLADIKWEAEYEKKKFVTKRMYVKPAKAFISESEMML